MTTVNVYLTFDGNCEEAFTFYKSIFGGEFSFIGRFGDMPASEKSGISAEENHKIMHVSLPISKETVLMGSDTAGEWAQPLTIGNNFSISINPETKEEAERIFNGFAQYGNIVTPLEETFWGAYFGIVLDQFGINWMINVELQSK